MTVTSRWTIAGRAVLSASALVILAGVPDILATFSPATRVALLVGIGALLPVWLFFWWYAIDSANRVVAAAAAAALTVVLAGLTYIAPPGHDGLLLAALAAGAAFKARRAVYAVVAIAVLAGGIQLLHGGSTLFAAGAAVNDLVVGAAAIGGRLLLATNQSLMRARDEIARLAINEERLRFARDVHDLLGQNLTLAILKSELIARDLPPSTPATVRETQRDLAVALRQALDDVRSAVAGYRRIAIHTELAAARSALSTAGIELTVDDQLGALPAVQDGVLAWVLRESVTNVIRHSGARHCVVRLRREQVRATLEVGDDGRGGEHRRDGSGLAGIAERLAAVGGSLEAAAVRGDGFTVRASVPLPAP
jgi:two-component system, NarL family, sensor histidine kinase DesK